MITGPILGLGILELFHIVRKRQNQSKLQIHKWTYQSIISFPLVQKVFI
jgi:hypothetical protein